MLKLEIFNKTRRKIQGGNFKKLLGTTAKVLEGEKIIKKSDSLSLELTWVGENEIQALNKEYRGKNKPTDVISLSYLEKRMHEGLVGEIFICIPYAKLQAKNLGFSLKQELEFLFVHGVLHVFGYDHKEEDELDAMMDLTCDILGRK